VADRLVTLGVGSQLVDAEVYARLNPPHAPVMHPPVDADDSMTMSSWMNSSAIKGRVS
jgi:hypothetical protein